MRMPVRLLPLGLLCWVPVAAVGGQPTELELQPSFSPVSGLSDLVRPLNDAAHPVSFSAQTILSTPRRGTLNITAELAPGWHIYSLTQKAGGPQRTEIRINPSDDFQITGPFTARPAPQVRREDVFDVPVEQHEDEVTWSAPLRFSPSSDPNSTRVAGVIEGQVCQDGGVCIPLSAPNNQFVAHVSPGSMAETTATPPTAQRAAPSSATLPGAESRTGISAATALPAATASTTNSAGQLDGRNRSLAYIAYVMGLAFLAGLILNVMPCVLPVIGLKIISFVQQAGENRGRILTLNVWFTLGLMLVFMLLATAAVFLKFGWGQQLQSVSFTIVLLSIVFVFALSFLGVWEIPIPGFASGTKANELAQQEGATGAFFKGILTTVLATPCSGPLLVPTVSWAVGQPALITYLTFFFVGLGMAFPYLLVGIFPNAVGFLPKPGAWMETFKQIMGFVLLGTVVFLFRTLDAEEYGVPIMCLLVGLGFTCWYLGRIPMTAGLVHRLRGWGVAGLLVVLSVWFSLSWMRSGVELEWQPFSRVALTNYLNEGRTVFVDFTADW